MPQLDISVYITQIFWLLITFISFWLIIDRFLLPKIGEKIEERKRKYNDYILKAEEINKKALDTLKIYEEKIAVARDNATQQINANEKEIETFIREKQEEINAKLKNQIAENEEKIASEMSKTMSQIDEMAKEVALTIVEQLDLTSLDKEDIENFATGTGTK